MIEFQHEQKGLFTFYKQQQKLQQELKRQKQAKKLGKNVKIEQKQKINKKLKYNDPNYKPPQYRLKNFLENRRSVDNANDYSTTPLQIYQFDQNKKEISPKGHSVVVLQQKKSGQQVLYKGSIDRRRSLLNHYTRSIYSQNQYQTNGFFLKNKEFPFLNQENISSYRYESVDDKNNREFQKQTSKGIFNDMSDTKFEKKRKYFKSLSKVLKLHIPLPQRNKKSKQRKSQRQKQIQQIQQNLKNSLSYNLFIDKSVLNSYQNSNKSKLPEIQSKRSNYILPKRYKSKKVQLALKSGDTQIIKKIRQSLNNDQSNKSIQKQEVSYIDIGVNKYDKNDNHISIDKKLIMQKNSKLLDILKKLKRGY